MIRGQKTYLTEIDWDNSETIRGWINDPEVHKYLATGHTPISKEDERRWFESQSVSPARQNFEIHVAEDGRYVGNVGVKGIDPIHRHAELGITVGRREDWGKGFGFDAIVTCLRYCFDTLGLHTVKIRAHADHARALDLYRRIGFVETGRERETVFQDGRFGDYISLDMIDREFRERYGAAE
jgi:RimJ/RimL family protein N-acetyltransferase